MFWCKIGIDSIEMNSCKVCGCGKVTGGMRGHAEKIGMKVSDKNYRYCVMKRVYVDAGNICDGYRPKKTVGYGWRFLSWRKVRVRKFKKKFISNECKATGGFEAGE